MNTNPCILSQQSETDSIVYVPLKSFSPVIPLNKPEHTTGCLIFSIIFLIIFAFLRIRGKNLFSLLMHVVIKRKKFEIIQNEGITPNLIYYLLALFLSFSAIATGAVYFFFGSIRFEYIFYTFTYLAIYHLFSLSLIRFSAWTFNIRTIGEEVIINLWTFNIMAGLLISPFVIAIFFVKAFAIPLLLEIIAICLILFYLVKFFRWIEILLAYRVSTLYMILYLCALEVIPLLILYKYLVHD